MTEAQICNVGSLCVCMSYECILHIMLFIFKYKSGHSIYTIMLRTALDRHHNTIISIVSTIQGNVNATN